jgi:hypothetical protein
VAATIYVLCACASAICTALLGRGYVRTRTRLLLWTGVCFFFLCVNSVLLVADRLIWSGTDLSLARGITGLVGLAALVVGLVWEAR